MQSKNKIVGGGAVAVLLLVFGVSQLQAQSPITLESLSNRIGLLAGRVAALERNSADENELNTLKDRVATLEARLEDTRPSPTATRRRPTSTPTPPPPTATPTSLPPTATPTPATPYITTTRAMNIRGGPGTNYDVVGYATAGEELIVTGKNADETWWRIELEGQEVWIYAFYVTATNTDGVQPVPTPVPPERTPSPSPTPAPQAQNSIYDLAYFVVTMDQEAIGRGKSWKNTSQAEQAKVVEVLGKFLIVTSDYCDLSIDEMTKLIDKYGVVVEQAGYSRRNEYAPRTNLLYELIQYAEDNPRRNSCDQLMEWRVILLLAEE